MADYYESLGLKKGASTEEIKKAYKEMAKKFHPDVSKEHEAEKKFKEINEAYSILSDPQKKEQYDQLGHDAFKGFSQGGSAGGFGGRGFGGAGFGGSNFDFEDIFSQFSSFGFSDFGDIFGNPTGGKRARKSNGSNIKKETTITFEEAAFGTTKEIIYERIERCEKCHGTGAEGQLKTCPNCKGRGAEIRQQRTPFGVFQTQTICHTCHGNGKIPEKICSKCDGDGLTAKKESIQVKIPAGINNANHLRLAGKGHEGKHGAGDLFIVVYVEEHEIFKRDEEDIYAEIPISFTEAALGAVIEVPTLQGKAELKIPAGTQSGTVFRIKGKGIARLNKDGFGDEYIKAILTTPSKLSKKQKELLEQLKKEDDSAKKRKGFIDRIIGK